MKKTYSLLLILALFGLAACKKSFLEENNKSGITADPFYSTTTGMESLVNACYTPSRFWFGKEGGTSLTELGTDLFLKGGDCHHPQYSTYDLVNFNSQDACLKLYWEQFYAAVNNCNTAIARMDASPLSADVKKQRLGEVHFLRALYYWIIVETWGGVHLTTEESKGVILTANRTPVEKFYDLIFSDLDIAIANLDAQTSAAGGRVTKPAAEGFKARMLLTRGKYAEAATLAKKVISSYNFKLFDNYASLWDMANSNGATNSEVIWFVNYTADDLINQDIPSVNGYTQEAAAFLPEGGHQLHTNFTPRYDFHEGVNINIADDIGFQRYAASKRLLSLYDETIDQRYKGTFKEVWYCNGGKTTKYTDMKVGDTAIYWSHKSLSAAYKQARATKFEIQDINDLYNSDQSLKDNRNFIEMHKFNDPTRSGLFVWRSKRDAFVMRISEMYLIVAEAGIQPGGNLAEGLDYMNRLRTKRAVPGKEAAMTVTASNMNIDFILEERARELVGEQIRWFDLKRTNKLLEYVKKYDPDGAANIQSYHLLRPIPQSQLDAVTNKDTFTQNPGYR